LLIDVLLSFAETVAQFYECVRDVLRGNLKITGIDDVAASFANDVFDLAIDEKRDPSMFVVGEGCKQSRNSEDK
jgi:hypothetical protein